MSDLTISKWLEAQGRTAASLAEAVGVSRGHLSHIMAGRFRASAELAVRIERETAGAVPRAMLRPDLFGEIEGEAA
jgi:DNA-binding transcriptional regulator YdaS (Cro superfamily)